jgi:DNA anti-recombination protein RmuC
LAGTEAGGGNRAAIVVIGAVFADTAQRGRAGEIMLENLLEAAGMGRHRDGN